MHIRVVSLGVQLFLVGFLIAPFAKSESSQSIGCPALRRVMDKIWRGHKNPSTEISALNPSRFRDHYQRSSQANLELRSGKLLNDALYGAESLTTPLAEYARRCGDRAMALDVLEYYKNFLYGNNARLESLQGLGFSYSFYGKEGARALPLNEIQFLTGFLGASIAALEVLGREDPQLDWLRGEVPRVMRSLIGIMSGPSHVYTGTHPFMKDSYVMLIHSGIRLIWIHSKYHLGKLEKSQVQWVERFLKRGIAEFRSRITWRTLPDELGIIRHYALFDIGRYAFYSTHRYVGYEGEHFSWDRKPKRRLAAGPDVSHFRRWISLFQTLEALYLADSQFQWVQEFVKGTKFNPSQWISAFVHGLDRNVLVNAEAFPFLNNVFNGQGYYVQAKTVYSPGNLSNSFLEGGWGFFSVRSAKIRPMLSKFLRIFFPTFGRESAIEPPKCFLRGNRFSSDEPGYRDYCNSRFVRPDGFVLFNPKAAEDQMRFWASLTEISPRDMGLKIVD